MLVTATAVALRSTAAPTVHASDAADLGSPPGLNQPRQPRRAADQRRGRQAGTSTRPVARPRRRQDDAPAPDQPGAAVTPASTPPSTAPDRTPRSEPHRADRTGPTDPDGRPGRPTPAATRSRSPRPRRRTRRSATPTTSAPPAATPATRSPSPSTPPPATNACTITGSHRHLPTTPAPASSPPTRPATTTTRGDRRRRHPVRRRSQEAPSRSPSPPRARPRPPSAARHDVDAPPAAPATRSPRPRATTNDACTVDRLARSPSATPAPASIAADQAGNDDYPPPRPSPSRFDVAKANQSITFTSKAPTSPAVGDTYAVTATGGDSGNPVTFGPATTNGACTVAGSTVTFRHARHRHGDPGRQRRLHAATDRPRSTFDVAKADQQSITFTSNAPSPAFGDTYAVTAPGRLRQPGHLLRRPRHHQQRLHRHRLHRHLPPRRHLRHRRRPGRQRRLPRRARPSPSPSPSRKATAVDHLHLQGAHRRRPSATPTPSTATGGDSGNPVTFSVDPATTNSACTVTGATVTFRHAGTCVIAADQAGNDDYPAATGHPVRHRRQGHPVDRLHSHLDPPGVGGHRDRQRHHSGRRREPGDLSPPPRPAPSPAPPSPSDTPAPASSRPTRRATPTTTTPRQSPTTSQSARPTRRSTSLSPRTTRLWAAPGPSRRRLRAAPGTR